MDGRLLAHRSTLAEIQFKGPLLRFEELTLDEAGVIYADFMNFVREHGVDDTDDMWRLYVKILHSWGIMCPHQQSYRIYEMVDGSFGTAGSPLPFSESKWFTCLLCDAEVINR